MCRVYIYKSSPFTKSFCSRNDAFTKLPFVKLWNVLKVFAHGVQGYYRNERKRLEYTRCCSLELNDWMNPALCGLGMLCKPISCTLFPNTMTHVYNNKGSTFGTMFINVDVPCIRASKSSMIHRVHLAREFWMQPSR